MTLPAPVPTKSPLPAHTPLPENTSASQPATSSPGEPTPTPQLSLFDVEFWSDASPDGEWVVQGITAIPKIGSGSGDIYYTQLKFSRAGDRQEWVPIDAWSHYGLGFTRPVIDRWSQDGVHVYILDSGTPDGCAPYSYESNLRRLSLADGSVQPLAPDLMGVLALSPDEKILAAVKSEQVTWLNLESGQGDSVDYQVDAPYWQGGNPTWSPDGKSLLFDAVSDPCSAEVRSSIFRVDLDSASITPLVENDARLLMIERWTEPDQAVVSEQKGQGVALWNLDLQTGVMTPR